MIQRERVTIRGNDCFMIYSDQGYKISKDGILYDIVFDPILKVRMYEETDQLIKE